MHDPDGTKAISIRDSLGILSAMEAGDVTTLLTIRDQILSERHKQRDITTLMLGLCDAAIARVEGRFTDSNTLLTEALRQAPFLGNPLVNVNPINIMLASLRVGNLMLAGQTRQWAIAQEEMQKQYFEPVRAYFHEPDLEFRNVLLLKLNVSAQQMPGEQIAGPAKDKIALLGTERQVGDVVTSAAEAIISVDGENTKATFDTGSLTGAVPATMARAHHWQVIGRNDQISNGQDGMRAALVVIVPSITIGQTTLRNQLMTMHQISNPIIGLQQMGLLRNIKMSRSEISFGAENPLSCTQKMVLASQRNGLSAHLLFPVSYGKLSSMGALDTGDNSPASLVVRMREIPEYIARNATSQPEETIFGQGTLTYSSKEELVNLGNRTFHSTVQYQQGHDTLPPAITFRALSNLTLQFDFPRGVSCLE